MSRSRETYTFKPKHGRAVTIPEQWISGFGLEDIGLCRHCGAERCQTEPDAREYPCDECEQGDARQAAMDARNGVADEGLDPGGERDAPAAGRPVAQ